MPAEKSWSAAIMQIAGSTLLGGGLTAMALLPVGCGEEETSSRSWGGRGGGEWGGGRGGEREAAAIPVRAEETQQGDMFAYVQTHARLEAERSISVVARAAGLVMELTTEEGELVQSGAVLARLDKVQLQLRMQQSQVSVDQARLAHERTTSLFSRALVSQEELDGVRHQLENARLDLKEARLNLEYADIRASISGVVMERWVEIGDMVNLNEPLFTIADLDPLLARIQIPEQRLHQVSVGQTARVVIDALPDSPFRGNVRMINPGVDPQSGTVKVTLEIPAGNGLRPGMFASVHIITGVHRSTLVIPKQALILETNEDDVLVYDDGRARRVSVELGYTEGDRVEVLQGLKTGDRVITVGQEGLKDGQAVRLAGELPSPADADREATPAAEAGASARGQWGGRGEEGRSMPDSASFVERVRERRGLTKEEAVALWQEMKEQRASWSGSNSRSPISPGSGSSLGSADSADSARKSNWRGGQ